MSELSRVRLGTEAHGLRSGVEKRASERGERETYNDATDDERTKAEKDSPQQRAARCVRAKSTAPHEEVGERERPGERVGGQARASLVVSSAKEAGQAGVRGG